MTERADFLVNNRSPRYLHGFQKDTNETTELQHTVPVGNQVTYTDSFTNYGVDTVYGKEYVIAAGSSPTVHNSLPGRSDADTHPASSITNTPAGNIAATTVQAAINELDAEKSQVGHGHTISDVSGLQGTLEGLDLLAQTSLLGFNQDAPPMSPSVGDAYIIGISPSGEWSGKASNLTQWTSGGWIFYVPERGWSVVFSGTTYWYDGAYWNIVHRKEQTPGLSSVIELTKPGRGWQGVCTDGGHIYVFTDRDENFSLKNCIQKYDMTGNLVSENTNAYTGTDSGGRFMSFGGGIHVGGVLYVAAYNNNDPASPPPYESKILQFDASTLAFVTEYDGGTGNAEGIAIYNGDYYVVNDYLNVVRKYNSSWVLQDEYALSQPRGVYGGPQSIHFEGNRCYINQHGPNWFDMTDGPSPGLDEYTFSGSAFSYVQTLKVPSYGCGQQCFPHGGAYFWNDRPGNRILVTQEKTSSAISVANGRFSSVAIATTSPLAPLHASNEGTGNAAQVFFDNYYTGATSTALIMRKARGTQASPSQTLANDQLGGFSFRGHSGADWLGTSAGIYAFAAENMSPATAGARLVFNTTPTGAATPLERMRLTGDGDVIAVGGFTGGKNISTSRAQSGGNVSFVATNTSPNAGSTAQFIAINDSSRGLRIQKSSSAAGNQLLALGPAGESAAVFTDSAHQLTLGTNGYAVINIRADSSCVDVVPSTASTSTTSGALVVTGGVGCGDYFTGKYRSSDGTAGLTAARTFYAASSSGGATNVLNTVTIKDGIITSWTQA
jgi:hypothetical protein